MRRSKTDLPLTNMRDLIRAFAGAMNLIDHEVEDHHEKVSFLAVSLAEMMGMNEREKRLAFYGALLHDVGSILERDVTLHDLESAPLHLARASAAVLRRSPVTESIAGIVSESQSPWERLRALGDAADRVHVIPQIIHLADVTTLLIRPDEAVLNQVERIRTCVHALDRTEFRADVLEAFDALCGREGVWLDALYRSDAFLDTIPQEQSVSLDETLAMTEFVSHIIDFRSPFTAMHSAGVSATAESLARMLGMGEADCKKMRIAGYLHDIGKLRIPREILEKPARLTAEEFNVMKEHAYYSHLLLSNIRGFEQIADWAANHHEKLNGSGYPFHLTAEEMSLGARIVAVSDVFSAITEDRPYRKGMTREEAAATMRADVARGMLPGELVEQLFDAYDEINAARSRRSRAASRRYQETLAAQ